MRVFVTGATGFIGSAVVKELIGAGHQVIGLARSEASAKALAAAGAEAHPGTIEDVESLRNGAAKAEGAIHTAYFHAFGHAGLGTRLRVPAGGSPAGIMSRFMAAAVETDQRAIETIGAALVGADRALVVAAPTMSLTPGRLGTERDAPDPSAVGGRRALAEEAAPAAASSRGVRASLIRLPPTVHGDGDTAGFIPNLIGSARKTGVSAYVEDGANRWGAVHRLDAARLFRLALENGSAGARYHGVAEEGVPFRETAEVIGRRLGVPVASKSPKEAAKQFGWLSMFVAIDNPVSGRLTQEQMEWHPTQPGLLADIDRTSYFEK